MDSECDSLVPLTVQSQAVIVHTELCYMVWEVLVLYVTIYSIISRDLYAKHATLAEVFATQTSFEK